MLNLLYLLLILVLVAAAHVALDIFHTRKDYLGTVLFKREDLRKLIADIESGKTKLKYFLNKRLSNNNLRFKNLAYVSTLVIEKHNDVFYYNTMMSETVYMLRTAKIYKLTDFNLLYRSKIKYAMNNDKRVASKHITAILIEATRLFPVYLGQIRFTFGGESTIEERYKIDFDRYRCKNKFYPKFIRDIKERRVNKIPADMHKLASLVADEFKYDEDTRRILADEHDDFVEDKPVVDELCEDTHDETPAHRKAAAEIFAGWPEWKRNISLNKYMVRNSSINEESKSTPSRPAQKYPDTPSN